MAGSWIVLGLATHLIKSKINKRCLRGTLICAHPTYSEGDPCQPFRRVQRCIAIPIFLSVRPGLFFARACCGNWCCSLVSLYLTQTFGSCMFWDCVYFSAVKCFFQILYRIGFGLFQLACCGLVLQSFAMFFIRLVASILQILPAFLSC